MSDYVVSADRPAGLRIACTTPVKRPRSSIERARRIAEWFGAVLVTRDKKSIEVVLDETAADVVIVADEPIRMWVRGHLDAPVFFHPGMAHMRIWQLRNGGEDRLVKAADIREGDTVVDATFGLGADSLVLSEAIGSAGKVIGVESSWLLGTLFLYAQRYEGTLHSFVADPLRRICLQIGNHVDILQNMKDNSADVVYFDPMFRGPLHNASSNLEGVRAFTNPGSLTDEAWEEAKRVARRAVVLKERPMYGEFERFGVLPDKPRARFAFGVWRKEGDHCE